MVRRFNKRKDVYLAVQNKIQTITKVGLLVLRQQQTQSHSNPELRQVSRHHAAWPSSGCLHRLQQV